MASKLIQSSLAKATSRRASVVFAQSSRVLVPVANSHTLSVPYTHLAITEFQNGVPANQVRELSDAEKRWDFWTTSDAFNEVKPKFGGLSSVPNGEVWVLQGGKVCQSGVHFLIPGVTKIKAVKAAYPVAMGVLSPSAASKNGNQVDAYAVVYVKITDPATSAFYVDPESNRPDSERAAAKIVRKTLQRGIGEVSVSPSGEISGADKEKLAAKITEALKAKEQEFGLQVVSVEVRGAFPSDSHVPDKLRALDPPLRAPDAAGHNLSADYWSEVLTPPYFEKRTFGSTKDVRTPATVSLEWAIPSPPDYHHFNEVPRMTAPPPKEVAKASH